MAPSQMKHYYQISLYGKNFPSPIISLILYYPAKPLTMQMEVIRSKEVVIYLQHTERAVAKPRSLTYSRVPSRSITSTLFFFKKKKKF